MKIVSDFKDYYDFGISYGIDEAVRYERFTKVIQPPKKIKHKQGGIIGFCGEFWEVINLHKEGKYIHGVKIRGNHGRFELNPVDIAELIDLGWVEGPLSYNKYDSNEIESQYFLRSVDLDTVDWNTSNWLQHNYSHWNTWLKSVFVEYGLPIFYVGMEKDNYEVTLNPMTLDYGLQKVLEPVDAFQKLSMFIPSLRQVDTFTMTDEEKGRSKGFDAYSFRHIDTKNTPKKF